MFTEPTDDVEDPISFMAPYSSLLSPNFTYCTAGVDAYIPNYYYHDESVSAGESIAQHLAEYSSNEPISTSSKRDANWRDINGIVVEQADTSRTKKHSNSVKQLISNSRRSSKADRHSKIATAQGPRDRRMRLSLDVAIPFFKLLDMLGCDKPSEAIRWLLLQSKPAIDKLKKGKLSPARCSSNVNDVAKSAPSTPEGEEVVGSAVYADKIACEVKPKAPSCKEKVAKHATRKSALKPVAKELRKKARQRARERTRKKKEVSMLNVDPAAGTCRPDHGAVNLQQSHVQIQVQDEGLSFGTTNWSQFMSLNYQQETQTCPFKPIPEFEFIQGASWEPYAYQQV